jgi:hypothetical protein
MLDPAATSRYANAILENAMVDSYEMRKGIRD